MFMPSAHSIYRLVCLQRSKNLNMLGSIHAWYAEDDSHPSHFLERWVFLSHNLSSIAWRFSCCTSMICYDLPNHTHNGCEFNFGMGHMHEDMPSTNYQFRQKISNGRIRCFSCTEIHTFPERRSLGSQDHFPI